MLVLAIETSTPTGSIALVRHAAGAPQDILFQESFASARSHNALLFAPLQRALECLAGASPDLVLAGLGPGSYTGIRIGIAAAHGVARALGCPWAGWNSFASLDTAPRFHVLGDARRGGFFLATLDHGQLAGDPEIFPLEELDTRLAGLEAPIFTTDAVPMHPALSARTPRAAGLAAYADAARSRHGAIEPLYLRAPYITAKVP